MNYLYDLIGYDGDQEIPRNNVSDQTAGAEGMHDHGTITRGNHRDNTGGIRGRGGRRGDTHLFGNRGSRRGDGVNHGNWRVRRDDGENMESGRGNRGGNHGTWRDRRDDSENRESGHGNKGGNHGNWRDRLGDSKNRGYRVNVRRGWSQDRFNMQSRDVSEDRQSAHSFQGNEEEPRTRNKYRGQNVHRGRSTRNRSSFRSGMDIERLEEMSNLDPEKLVICLTNENAELEKLFDNELSNDYIVLILRVIARLCESAFHQNKAQVLCTVCEPKFVDKLNLYLSDIALHDQADKRKNIYFWEDQEKFWNNLLNVYENILKIIPNRGCDVLPKLVKRTGITIDDMEREQHSTVSEELKKRLKELEAEIMSSIEEREKKNKIISQNEEPPDDFRQISLYPSVYEITHNHQQVFLRQNIVEGKYNSVDHYLDVQFRLLREDFVAPLREGVCEYLRQLKTKEHNRIYNVHIYKDVVFSKKQTIQGKIVSVVQLPPMRNKVTLENSKRFMFGSLVCFTRDNFKTIIFGTVANQDKNSILFGRIAVDILENNTVDKGVPYIMIECSVFFEPYYNVLKALQVMTENTFPFKKYIIDVISEVCAPSYYLPLSRIRHENRIFFPLIPRTWPSHTELELDPSQFRAFQAALTKEFCVIQGPPGTGKTFIGLKVAHVLLENRNHWNRGPILVICFTNHALDQFLEGILRYTSKLVRIGGQSKSEILEEFNIREVRKRTEIYTESAELLRYRRVELEYFMDEISRNNTLLEIIYSGNGIINLKKIGIVDDKFRLSWFERVKSDELLDWLLGGRSAEERYEERGRYRLAQVQAQMQQQNQNEGGDTDFNQMFFDAGAENMREIDDRDDFNIDLEYLFGRISSSFTLKTIENYELLIIQLEIQLAALEKKMEKTNEIFFFIERYTKENELIKTRNDLDYLKYRMYQFRTNNVPPRPQHVDYNNPHILTANERWGLYFHWLHLYCKWLNAGLQLLEEEYRTVYRRYEEIRHIEDVAIMRRQHVIGMTTSGAARYQNLLQALKCPIVIVEEAAEVLESHVVVSLTTDCKHLILIGDHQQLRPTTAEYKIAKKYNLEISLFERMVKNNIHCVQLEVQHRMRPEIAQLIVPSIYPKLDNHPSVEMYPPVRGITKNLFFITHTEAEENLSDTSSKRNIHEAKFLIKLTRHLILQGYEPHEITILATYSGQMFCLWKERQQHTILKDVRITVVDNFQGEESKIILLSLVRSNEDDNVGFLKIDNRICVALSRAKEGMYIIGNMDILAKSSTVWREIKTVLENNNQLDTHLTLQCQIHPDRLTRVAKEEDFDQVIEGGCSQLCEEELQCGHICTSLCHTTDKQWYTSTKDVMEIDDLLEDLKRAPRTSLLSDVVLHRFRDRRHVFYKCKEKCKKILCELNHPCPDQCFEKCKPCMVPKLETLKCNHTHSLPCHLNSADFFCPTKVEVVLDCEHRANKPCHRDIKMVICPHLCDNKIGNCGHACPRKCHIHDDPNHLELKCVSKCERPKANCSVGDHMCPLLCHEECPPCEVIINKKRSCGHMHKVECRLNVEDVECNKRCNKKLDCGHKCMQSCTEPCGKCSERVTKVIPECKHTIKMKCSDSPVRSKCGGKCPLTLSCGHPCNKTCRERCQTKCEYLVDNPIPAVCGHQFQIPCHKANTNLEPISNNLLQHCRAPCNALLLCKHRCTGTCGTCAQGRVHATCLEKCGRLLVCGHECSIPCKEICLPCKKRCSYRCAHSKCGQKCGEPCKPCMESCTRRCAHVRCSKKCNQICDVPPCTVPCPKNLKCGHPCIGYCGDPCPPICRVCNPDDETFEVMFGREDEPDARFVYLAECKHVIEAEAMDNWLNQHVQGDVKEINVKNCPKCKTTLAVTQRYSTFIKEAFADINKVKEKWFGHQQQNEEKRIELLKRIAQLQNIKNLFTQSALLKPILHNLQNILKEKYKGKRNPLNIIAVISVTSQLGLIETLVNAFTNGDLYDHENLYEACLERLNYILKLMHNKDGHISKQRISEIEMEINRFERFVQLCTIEKNQNFKPAVALPNIITLYNRILNTLNSIERYSEATDEFLKTSLENLAEAVTITEEEKQSNVAAVEEQNHTLLSKATDGSLKVSSENLADAVDKSVTLTKEEKQSNVAATEEQNHTLVSEATDGSLQASLENLAEGVSKSMTTEQEKPSNVAAIKEQNHTLLSEATDGSLKASLENLAEGVSKSMTTEEEKQSNVAAIDEQNHTFLSEATDESLKSSSENLAEAVDKSMTIIEQEMTSSVAAAEEQNHILLSKATDGSLKVSSKNLADAVDKSMTIIEQEMTSNVAATEEQNHTLVSEATDASLQASLENLAEGVSKSMTTEQEKPSNVAAIKEQNHTLLSEATDGSLKASLENLAEGVSKSMTTEEEKQSNVAAIDEQNHTFLSEATDESLKSSSENLAEAVDKSMTIIEQEMTSSVAAAEEQNHILLSKATDGSLKVSSKNLADAVDKSMTIIEQEMTSNVAATEEQNHTLVSEATDASLQASLENLAEGVSKSMTTEQEKPSNVAAIKEQNHTLLSEATDGSLKASLENLAEGVSKSMTTEEEKQSNVAAIDEQNHTFLSEATDESLKSSSENLAEAVDKSMTIIEQEMTSSVAAAEEQNHILLSKATDGSLKVSSKNLADAVDKSMTIIEQEMTSNVAATEEQNHTLVSEATDASLQASLENLAEGVNKSMTTEQEMPSKVAAIEEQNHTLLSEATDGSLKASLENLAEGVSKSMTTEEEKQSNVAAIDEQNHTLLSEATDGSLKLSSANLAEAVDKSMTIIEQEMTSNVAATEEQNHTLVSEATDASLKASLENLIDAVDKSVTLTKEEKQSNIVATEEQNPTLLSEATDGFLKASSENLAEDISKSITITEEEKQSNVAAVGEQNHTLLSEATDESLKPSLENLTEAVVKSVTTEEEKRSIVAAMQENNEGLGNWVRCPNGHFFTISKCEESMPVAKCIECGAQLDDDKFSL